MQWDHLPKHRRMLGAQLTLPMLKNQFIFHPRSSPHEATPICFFSNLLWESSPFVVFGERVTTDSIAHHRVLPLSGITDVCRHFKKSESELLKGIIHVFLCWAMCHCPAHRGCLMSQINPWKKAFSGEMGVREAVNGGCWLELA